MFGNNGLSEMFVQITPWSTPKFMDIKKRAFYSISKSCKCKNYITVGKVLKGSLKWVVLEVCSFIHLEVIICSWHLLKWRFFQDCKLASIILRVYIFTIITFKRIKLQRSNTTHLKDFLKIFKLRVIKSRYLYLFRSY